MPGTNKATYVSGACVMTGDVVNFLPTKTSSLSLGEASFGNFPRQKAVGKTKNSSFLPCNTNIETEDVASFLIYAYSFSFSILTMKTASLFCLALPLVANAFAPSSSGARGSSLTQFATVEKATAPPAAPAKEEIAAPENNYFPKSQGNAPMARAPEPAPAVTFPSVRPEDVIWVRDHAWWEGSNSGAAYKWSVSHFIRS